MEEKDARELEANLASLSGPLKCKVLEVFQLLAQQEQEQKQPDQTDDIREQPSDTSSEECSDTSGPSGKSKAEEVRNLIQELSLPPLTLLAACENREALSSLSYEQLEFLEHDKVLVVDNAFEDVHVLRAAANEARELQRDGKLRPAGMSRGDRRWINEGKRSDEIAWVHNSEEVRPTIREERVLSIRATAPGLAEVLDRIDSIRLELNEACNFQSKKTQTQLAMYMAEGAGYVRHIDAFRGGNEERRLTVLLYLNEAWTEAHGGCLRVFLPNAARAAAQLLRQEASCAGVAIANSSSSASSGRAHTVPLRLESDSNGEIFMDIAPRFNRMVIFHSAAVEHAVLPSFAPRIALTTWFY